MSGFQVESPNAQRQADLGGRVRDVPRPNFILYYHPAEWQLTENGELTPSISHFSLAPGAGADEHGNFTARAAELQARGYVQIPHDVLGESMPDYVASYTNHRGRKVNRTVFQEPYNDGTGNTKWLADTEAIRAFVAYLRRRGIVKPPRPEVIAGILTQQERVLDRLASIVPRDNDRAHRRLEQKMQAVERSITNLRAELDAANDAYGRRTAPANAVVRRLLARASEDADDAAATVRAVRAPRVQPRRTAKKEADQPPAAPVPPAPPAPPKAEDPPGGFSVEDPNDPDPDGDDS